VTPAWPHGDPRDVAHAILAAPPYTSVARPAPRSLFDAIMAWIGRQLGGLFHAIGHLLGAEASHATLIGGLIVAAIALSLAFGYVRLADAWVRRRNAPARPRDRASHAAPEVDWLARVAAAAAEERWREAAAALVHAAFIVLDRSGRLPYDASRTPAEARRALTDPAFDGFARDADLALFAPAAATRERFERMRAAFGRLA
jgi:hypothetical protein